MLSIVGPHRVRGSLYEQCGVHSGDNDLRSTNYAP